MKGETVIAIAGDDEGGGISPRQRLARLGLSDGMVRITDTFEEVLWDDEEPHPVLSHNAKSVVDVLFPHRVFELTGIRGIGVHELDLICWLKEAADRSALAFEENQEVWLDELAGAERRDAAVAERYRAERARQRALKRSVSAAPEVRTHADPDAVLEELSALFYDAAA